MQFFELGKQDNPAIVMLPAMMCSKAMHMPVAEILSGEFHVVLPTYDGHCRDGSPYTSTADQCEKIRRYLDERGIEDVALVQGSSMGAEIALELLRERPSIRNAFFDGGPFFNFPGPIRKVFGNKFMDIIVKAKGYPGDEDAIAGFAASKDIQAMIPSGEGGDEEVDMEEVIYAILSDLVPIARTMDRSSVENLAQTCYACALPAFDEATQRKMTFHYGKELACKALRRVRKAYPHALYLQGTMGHCSFELTHPREYAVMLAESIRKPCA